jgi:hypothetical protein
MANSASSIIPVTNAKVKKKFELERSQMRTEGPCSQSLCEIPSAIVIDPQRFTRKDSDPVEGLLMSYGLDPLHISLNE